MTEASEERKQDRDEGPMAGERLAAARRAQNVSVLEIAKELHLDEFKIRALESNDFAVLGAPVFAKGHLRKYAELVNVPIDDVLADYYKLNRAQPAPPVVGPKRKRQREIQLGPWLAAIVFVGIVAAAGYWWLGRPPSNGGQARDAATESRNLPPTAQPLDSTDAAANSETVTAPASEQQAPAAAAAAIPAAAEPDPTVADSVPVSDPVAAADSAGLAADVPTVTLALEFSGDCWTEVTDADGQRLFFDLATAGRRVSVGGRAPLRVLVGNIENVQLRVDGEPYVVPDSARRGQTATLTIDSQ
ncbi:MAG: DUF4115 domain-containing protein [Gammaproteobacteria bacterium]|nr:DUF4115 domain-containing protein [Gammaproteobacteria bacterium]MDH4252980.1 DUF4115 domain-containing protein [Gammaproteobacteria bacterium]MDH5308598.1 DUF4115 domain-containing protein [Gammaproteobacteria bacterium]